MKYEKKKELQAEESKCFTNDFRQYQVEMRKHNSPDQKSCEDDADADTNSDIPVSQSLPVGCCWAKILPASKLMARKSHQAKAHANKINPTIQPDLPNVSSFVIAWIDSWTMVFVQTLGLLASRKCHHMYFTAQLLETVLMLQIWC